MKMRTKMCQVILMMNKVNRLIMLKIAKRKVRKKIKIKNENS